jgi:hypothetical protein
LVLFSLDKYIADRQDEHSLVQEQSVELNTLRMVYEESQKQAMVESQRAQQAQQARMA